MAAHVGLPGHRRGRPPADRSDSIECGRRSHRAPGHALRWLAGAPGPAASLKRWNLPHRGYKRAPNVAKLGQLVDAILAIAPWLRLNEFDSVCRRSDHAIDAIVAALTARAAHLGRATIPPAGQRDLAAIEGWIAVPTSELPDII